MTAYKLVTVEFKWFGLQGKVENFIQSTERRLFTNFHRQVGRLIIKFVLPEFATPCFQVFCWTDRWHGMTMDDIRALEDKTKEELEEQRKSGEVRGTKPL